MNKPTPRRKALTVATTLATFAFGVALAVSVAGSASASGPLTTSTDTSSSSAPPPAMGPSTGFDLDTPQAQFLVINGSVSATSDHEIVGSSAFPNFTTGAVDNYYSMSRSHMDNSPFSEGTASPADTGPVGQTAAAGNFQQPQYADARWPGGPDQAKYGTKGQAYAEAAANESVASADATDGSNGLSGPGLGGSKTLPVPKGFDSKLEQALAGWKSKFLGCPAAPKKPPLPSLPAAPKPPKVKAPKPPKVTTPTATVTTPVATVATPSTGTSAPAAPSVSVPAPSLPSTSGATRSLSAVPSPCSSSGSGSGSDGETALTSSTLGVLVPGPATANTDIGKVDTAKLETAPPATATTTTVDTTQTSTTAMGWKPKPYTLLMGGESSMGRLTIGHGQIVIEGIHVTGSVANDGTTTPTYKAGISIASASIGGVPVTIDEKGVHVAGQHQSLPYKQASDSLNAALKQAGIEIYLVSPQVTNCAQAASAGMGTDTTATTTDTTTTTSDQSGAGSPCGQAAPMCAPGTGTGTDTTATTTTATDTTSTDQSGMAPPSSCPPPDACGTGTATGGDTGTSTTTTTSGPPGIGGSTTTTSTTTTGQTDTTSTTSSFCPSPAPTTSGCAPAGSAPTSTTSTDQSGGVPPPPPGTDPMATGSAGQETILSATGVHVVFTQPVSPSGVPAQFVEHILGEVYVDSLAAPATPIPALGPLGASPFSTSSSSSCPGGRHSGSSSSLSSSGGGGGSSSAATAGGGSLAGGAGIAGSPASSGSALGATSETGGTPGSTGTSLPATIAAALRKPLWLLLAYLVWQALVIGTGVSLWNWRREDIP